MDKQDTKNKMLFKRIVEDVFDLTDESFGIFKERLFFNREIAPEYKEIIGDAPDLRARFNLGESISTSLNEHLKKLDKGYPLFLRIFHTFSTEYSITYEDYYRNKKQVDGNDVKLSKLLKEYYKNNKGEYYKNNKGSYLGILVNDFQNNYFNNGKILEFLKNTFNINIDKENTTLNNLAIGNGLFDRKLTISISSYYDKIGYMNKIRIHLEEEDENALIDFIIKVSNELIGTYKMPRSSGLQLVFSLNPVDWFLASTGEDWSSCLNLNHDGEVYWQGLPQLIGDKNRAMIYITDGRKKEWEGIKVDRIISRSWILLLRTKEDNKTHFHFVKEYPGNFDLKGISEKIIGKRFMSAEDLQDLGYNKKKIISRYYIELLLNFIESGDIAYSTIYLDSTKVKIAKKNKAKYRFGEYGYYKLGSGSYSMVIKPLKKKTKEFFYSSDFPPIDDLLNNAATIGDYIEE